MATNKHATIRYRALDRCFNNYGKRYFIDDLINACNEALYEFSGIDDGVKRRQVFDDIKFMESEQGWSIPLQRLKDGRKVYYRYEDKSFSISNQGINTSEAEQLKETLSILSRFKGLPQFEWIEEMQVRLEDTFKLRGTDTADVSFEQNPYLKGLEHFTKLFSAIKNKVALQIIYKGFKQNKATIIDFHPWHLKQYNNRWFLFGFNEQYVGLSSLAIDRIISIEESKLKYKENIEIDFEELFEDVIGVSVKANQGTEKLIIKIANEVWPYIESKPLHGSQKVKTKDHTGVEIELNIQVNHELYSTLFSYMDAIEVVDPKSVRDRFKEIINTLTKKYN